VKNAFEELRDNVPENLLPVKNYFEENYGSGRPGIPLTIPKYPVPVLMLFYFNALLLGRGRKAVPPRYRISLWNQHEATRQGLGRTNNISEVMLRPKIISSYK